MDKMRAYMRGSTTDGLLRREEPVPQGTREQYNTKAELGDQKTSTLPTREIGARGAASATYTGTTVEVSEINTIMPQAYLGETIEQMAQPHEVRMAAWLAKVMPSVRKVQHRVRPTMNENNGAPSVSARYAISGDGAMQIPTPTKFQDSETYGKFDIFSARGGKPLSKKIN